MLDSAERRRRLARVNSRGAMPDIRRVRSPVAEGVWKNANLKSPSLIANARYNIR